jgi:hypothetical protein
MFEGVITKFLQGLKVGPQGAARQKEYRHNINPLINSSVYHAALHNAQKPHAAHAAFAQTLYCRAGFFMRRQS